MIDEARSAGNAGISRHSYVSGALFAYPHCRKRRKRGDYQRYSCISTRHIVYEHRRQHKRGKDRDGKQPRLFPREEAEHRRREKRHEVHRRKFRIYKFFARFKRKRDVAEAVDGLHEQVPHRGYAACKKTQGSLSHPARKQDSGEHGKSGDKHHSSRDSSLFRAQKQVKRPAPEQGQQEDQKERKITADGFGNDHGYSESAAERGGKFHCPGEPSAGLKGNFVGGIILFHRIPPFSCRERSPLCRRRASCGRNRQGQGGISPCRPRNKEPRGRRRTPTLFPHREGRRHRLCKPRFYPG